MNKNSSTRALVITFAFLCISIAICIANVIKLNIIALCLDIVLIMSICFILGYYFSRYESIEREKPTEIEEEVVMEIVPAPPTILDGKEL